MRSTDRNDDAIKAAIERGDVERLRLALAADAGLANRPIRWHLNQENESEPLHYVSDCVAQGWLSNGTEAEIAALLIEHGARIDGTAGRETPLLASASLGVDAVSRVLIDAGATLEATSIFGARALHWAAWIGSAATVDLLVANGAEIEPRCSEFGATPLFWAVHGYGPKGPKPKRDQVGAARTLVAAGASVEVANKQGRTALEAARLCASSDMYAMLSAHAEEQRA